MPVVVRRVGAEGPVTEDGGLELVWSLGWSGDVGVGLETADGCYNVILCPIRVVQRGC